MSNRGLLYLCIAGTLPIACALPKIDTEYDKDAERGAADRGTGGHSIGGTSATAGTTASNGGTSAASGAGSGAGSNGLGGNTTAGGSGVAGNDTTSVAAGGTVAGGGASNLGGSIITAGRSGAAGATPAGGASNTGGAAAAGNPNATGGNQAVAGGGNAATGGASTGGRTAGGASTGGASTGGRTAGGASTGGTSATGGTSTGGAINLGGAAGASVTPKAIATGWYHSCALMTNGTVRCWGSEYCGALGNGTCGTKTCDPFNDVVSDVATASSKQTAPVQVANITSATAIARDVGNLHNCVIVGQGSVACWGYNQFGQLGDGTKQACSPTPVSVTSISTATSVVVGYQFTCALLMDTTVQCWGINATGELGNNSRTESATPQGVVDAGGALLKDVASISAGWWHTCAMKTDGTVWCWGNNGRGQLGVSTPSDSLVAFRTAFPVGVEVSAGGEFTCVRDAANAIWCSGYNEDGELGLGNTSTITTPTKGVSPSDATLAAMYAGGNHTCASMNTSEFTGIVKCWGYNYSGQLGNGTTTTSLSPVTATGLANVTQLSPDTNHTCALSGGAVYCWGNNDAGQIGVSSTGNVVIPKLVSGL